MSKIKFKQIQVGEVLSTTIYATVLQRNSDGILVRDSLGQEYEIRGQKLIEESMSSGSQFTQTVALSKTELAALLIMAGDKVFTVTFIKADGTSRTLTGHLVDTENHMGRSNVIDLVVKKSLKENGLRQVDHRTIQSLILAGIKYTLK